MSEAPERRRGRPKGSTKTESRDLIIHGAVYNLLTWGYTREAACELVRILLAQDQDAWTEVQRGRRTILASAGRALKFIDPSDEAFVYGLALNVRRRLQDAGLREQLHLSAKSVQRAFDRCQALLRPARPGVICPECGHLNTSNGITSPDFMPGDPCRGRVPGRRECGAFTWRPEPQIAPPNSSPEGGIRPPRISWGRTPNK